jgi:hypothetical protein
MEVSVEQWNHVVNIINRLNSTLSEVQLRVATLKQQNVTMMAYKSAVAFYSRG